MEKVESGNSGPAENVQEITEPAEQSGEGNKELHCYVVFEEDISAADGTAQLVDEILDGQNSAVQRIDEKGNAAVVILAQEQYQKASELEEVKSITITEEAELTGDALAEEASEEESEALGERTSEAEELQTEQMTEFPDTEQMTTESLTESITESPNDFFISHSKGLRAAAIVVIIIVAAVVYVQQKRRG